MSSSKVKVLIIGASGAVGGALLQQLLTSANPSSIRVSTRDPSKATFPSSIEVVQGDLEDASSYPALFNGITRVFMYANAKAPLPELLAAAKEGGVKYIVLLSSLTIEINPDGFLAKMHRNVEAAIEESGLSYTFFRPRNFASNSRQYWAPTIQKTGKLWITYPNAQSAPVSEDDMAAVALVALTTDKLLNKTVGLSGSVSITQQEQVEAISRVREREGKKPVELIVLPAEDWKAYMIQHMPSEFLDQLITLWRLADGHPEVIQSSERITGKPSQSYDQWLEVNKDAFLKD